MQPKPEFLSTSVASTLLTRFSRTHERRRISVIAGNPGIGKTTVIERFRDLNPGRVALIDLGEGPKGGHTATGALNFAVSAVDGVIHRHSGRGSTNHIELRHRFWEGVCAWANIRERDAAAGDLDRSSLPLCTIIFDEAQHLSRSGVEALRSINDASRGGFSPLPVGIIFVGNHEFALKATRANPSVLTEAVVDRLLYNVSLDYGHVTDDDLCLYLESKADFEPGALRLALKFFGTDRVNRSFRSADRLLDRLAAEIGRDRITVATIKHILAIS